MYNSDLPTRAELPSSRQLLRSTFIAFATAVALLVTVVLPAEYGIDPTGAGRLLGLKDMGEIKVQLQQEAERDAASDAQANQPDRRSSLLGRIVAGLLIGEAHAHSDEAHEQSEGVNSQSPKAHEHTETAEWKDETSVTLQPGEAVELKADLKKGEKIQYFWTANGGRVNHDTHGEPHSDPSAFKSYSKGRGVKDDEGTLEAAFDGRHGWFWRNRSSDAVTVTLKTSGDYTEIKRMK